MIKPDIGNVDIQCNYVLHGTQECYNSWKLSDFLFLFSVLDILRLPRLSLCKHFPANIIRNFDSIKKNITKIHHGNTFGKQCTISTVSIYQRNY